jgi:hypothetical protein
MSTFALSQVLKAETAGSDRKPLYKLAAAASVGMVIIVLIQFAVFMSAPPPYEGTAIDWFRLFQRDPIVGLINFELLMVLYTIISIPISLALYMTLRRGHPAFTALYLALSLTGVIAFIAARPAFEMLYLSNGYAAATSDAQRSMFLAAGQVLVATFHGTAFHVSYILGSLSGLIISLVMLKSNVFSKATAAVRIASSVCDFGLYVPGIGMYISIFSVLFLVIWNILIARRLFQLGQNGKEEVA